MRRLLKARTTLVRAEVVMKNQIRALLTAEGDGRQESLAAKQKRAPESPEHPQRAGKRARSPAAL
jgi:hypothetical protein